MRILMLAGLSATALFLFAPAASAAQRDEPAPQASELEEAPVDLEAERLFCPRRVGGPSGRRVAHRCPSASAEDSISRGASDCAARYDYRGHRRVHLRLHQCRPLFTRSAPSAI